MRPHEFYKSIFHQRVAETGATSILDVGCGRGDWVHELRQSGVQAIGLDTSQSISHANPWIQQGRASALPFEDQSVDLVASEFSAHHFEHLAEHMAEAFRVARRGIAILDPWYDDSIASQRVARRMDDWMKRIDRAAGEAHHPVISAGDFMAALPELGAPQVHVEHLLRLEPVPQDTIEGWFEHYTKKADGDAGLLADEAEIRAEIADHGLSQDGAIIIVVTR